MPAQVVDPEYRRSTRSRNRRAALIKEATAVFLKVGYERASLDDIVSRAGGSKSSIYTEFGGKMGLFRAAIEEACSRLFEPALMVDHSKLTLEASLTIFGEMLLRQITMKESIALDRLILSEAVLCPEIGIIWYKNGPERVREICAHIISSHLKEVGDVKIPVQRLAARFHDMLIWDVQHRRMADLPVSRGMIQQTVHDAVHILLYGLRTATH